MRVGKRIVHHALPETKELKVEFPIPPRTFCPLPEEANCEVLSRKTGVLRQPEQLCTPFIYAYSKDGLATPEPELKQNKERAALNSYPHTAGTTSLLSPTAMFLAFFIFPFALRFLPLGHALRYANSLIRIMANPTNHAFGLPRTDLN